MKAPARMADSEMLECLEAALECVSAALRTQDAQALEQSCTRLHQAAQALAQLAARQRPVPGVGRLALHLAQQRSQLARLCVHARQRTAALLPGMDGPPMPYGPAFGGQAQHASIWRGQVEQVV